MDAPLYPPATEFVQPQRLPAVLSTRDSAIRDLMDVPAAWAIVIKAAPIVGMAVRSPQMQPMLTTLSLRSLMQFGLTTPAILARIDTEFQALGPAR